jgi:DNA-binding Xre family transcriptional regulator
MNEKNRKIVEFIRDNWLDENQSNLSFATSHGIDEKTVRLIKEDQNYNISFKTILRICEARELKLYEFFKMINI